MIKFDGHAVIARGLGKKGRVVGDGRPSLEAPAPVLAGFVGRPVAQTITPTFVFSRLNISESASPVVVKAGRSTFVRTRWVKCPTRTVLTTGPAFGQREARYKSPAARTPEYRGIAAKVLVDLRRRVRGSSRGHRASSQPETHKNAARGNKTSLSNLDSEISVFFLGFAPDEARAQPGGWHFLVQASLGTSPGPDKA